MSSKGKDKTQRTKRYSTLSLLEPESRGGQIAKDGFSFQDYFLLSRIPLWLNRDGFTSFTQESIGDIEAKFFVPGGGFEVEFYEVKDHPITPYEFWKDLERFQQVYNGSPGTYRLFYLVSPGLSKELKSLVNSLRRVRDAYDFYQDGAEVKDNSYKEYVQKIKDMGHTEQQASFLFEKVLLKDDYVSTEDSGDALFNKSLLDHLPEYEELPSKMLKGIYKNLLELIKGRNNKPTNRVELEKKMREGIDNNKQPQQRSILLETSLVKADPTSRKADEKHERLPVKFEWSAFSGGQNRSFPPSEQWNNTLMVELRKTRDWILKYRSSRRIKLIGNRRLSSSLAIGAIFSAIKGFAIDMSYREECWATDDHPKPNTQYLLSRKAAGDSGEHLVMSIGIIRDIAEQVENSLMQHGLTGMPRLHIHGEQAITSPQQANLIVRNIKDLLSQALSRTGSKQVHFFYAGPAYLALFLGHRLNATAPIQCYEWVSANHYVKTCSLFSEEG